jgi:hypothetical protein
MRTWWIGLVVGTIASFAACSADKASDTPGGGNSSGTGSGGSGNGSGSGGSGNGTSGSGTGSVQLVDATPGDSNADVELLGDAACARATEQAHLTTVNLIFMIDKSQSMGDQAPFQNLAKRWTPAQEGLLAFFNEPGSQHLYAAMDFFAADGYEDTACDPNQYKPPNFTVPLTSLESNGTFVTTLQLIQPQGGTPTWPAMRGALDYATEVATADPTAKTIVVLVTDGEPGLNMVQADGGPATMREVCQEIGVTQVPNTVPEIANIVRAAYEGTPQILTYVFGITDVANSLISLNAIARAGSGDQEDATIIVTTDPTATAQTLQNKLSDIRTNSVTCDLTIPPPTTGEAVDPNLVNVYVTMDGQLTLIKRNDGCGGAGTNIGWYYDNPVTPTKITLCGCPANNPNCNSTCNAVQGNATAQLSIEFGCATIVQ